MQKLKKIKKILRKNIITVWLIVSAVAFCGIIAYAKFDDSHNSTKRVVSTGTNDKILFTSNLLTISNSNHPKSVAKGYTADSTYDINIYNYDRTKPTAYYPNTINYTLKTVLVKPGESGTVEYDISNQTDLNKIQTALCDNTDENNPVYKTIDIYELTNGTPGNTPVISLGNLIVDNTLTTKAEDSLSSEQLVPGSTGSAVKSYRVVIPKEAIDSNIYVKITAEPNGHSDLPTSIGGIFYVQSQNKVEMNGWNGTFVDSRSVAPSGYDAFNFRITGAGTATKVLKWNSEYVQPNKQQILELFGVTLTASTNQLSHTFPLQAGVYSYDIQFYVKDSTAREYIDSLTWDQLIAAKIVSLEDPA